MKLIKYIYHLSIIIATILTICLSESCTQNPCDKYKIECKNGGACVNGSCLCAYAFSGTLCENRITKPYEGTYTGTETDTAATTNVSLTVTGSNVTADKIDITLKLVTANQVFSPYAATVKYDGNFIIADQLIINKTDTIYTKTDSLYVAGTGKRTDRAFDYTLYYSPSIDSIKNSWKTRMVRGSVVR